jgi:hypothetical protein
MYDIHALFPEDSLSTNAGVISTSKVPAMGCPHRVRWRLIAGGMPRIQNGYAP